METKDNNSKVIVKKIVQATPDKVFKAWTDPSLMSQWLFPGEGKAETTNDLRVGGKYSHDMLFKTESDICEAGASDRNGYKSYLHYGEYIEIIPNEKLVFTWNSPSVNDTRVTIEIKPLNNGTEVTVIHELLEGEKSIKGHTEGWEGCLQNLEIWVVGREG